jgi:hypothetical protein
MYHLLSLYWSIFGPNDLCRLDKLGRVIHSTTLAPPTETTSSTSRPKGSVDRLGGEAVADTEVGMNIAPAGRGLLGLAFL